jgi:hypothetical protein
MAFAKADQAAQSGCYIRAHRAGATLAMVASCAIRLTVLVSRKVLTVRQPVLCLAV